MKEQQNSREALTRIVEIARAALSGNGSKEEPTNGHDHAEEDSFIGCSIRQLPERLQFRAAEAARRINPTNAPNMEAMTGFAADMVSDPSFLTVMTTKYWGPAPRRLTVSFMETTPQNLRTRIISHMNAWSRSIGITFAETTGVGKVRISRSGSGYWSYLGTDILQIPSNRPTMNLQGFTMNTPESEFKRVVRHETGHTLGFPHEHMRQELVNRIDPQKAYDYFWRTQGWNRAMVDQQVLTSLNARTIMGTPADQTSIMCYQLPGSITRDGRPITGGVDINATDYTFAGTIYPKPGRTFRLETEKAAAAAPEWSESEDVPENQIDSMIRETLLTADELV